jgi:hypothetical protein
LGFFAIIWKLFEWVLYEWKSMLSGGKFASTWNLLKNLGEEACRW